MPEPTPAQVAFARLLEASNVALEPLLETTLKKQMPVSFTLIWRLGQVEGLCLVMHLLDDTAFESHFERLVNTDASGPLWPYDMMSFLNVFIQDAPTPIPFVAALQAVFNDRFNGLALEQKRSWMNEYENLIQAIRVVFAEASIFAPKPDTEALKPGTDAPESSTFTPVTSMGAWGFD